MTALPDPLGGAQSEGARRLKGIGLMLLAGMCFTCLDTAAKTLVVTYASLQIVFVRFFGHLVLTVGAAALTTGLSSLWRTKRPLLMIVRSLLLTLSTLLNFFAIRYLQLSETVSIFFSAPLLVAVLAGPLLGEWIGPRRWIAVLVGFAGVLVVTRPGVGGIHWAALLSFTSAISYAFYAIITRIVATNDGNAVQQFYAALVGTLVFLPMMPAVWVWPSDIGTLALMAATGFFGFIGHNFLINAHRFAPAAILSPFIYAQIAWMTIAGYLAFGDVPSRWTMAGALIVASSGIYLILRERKVRAG